MTATKEKTQAILRSDERNNLSEMEASEAIKRPPSIAMKSKTKAANQIIDLTAALRISIIMKNLT